MANSKRMHNKTLLLVFKTWETQLAAGVDVVTSTEKLFLRIHRRKPNTQMDKELRYLVGQLKTAGKMPSQVLRPYLSQTEFMILQSGDQSGKQHESISEILRLRDGRKGIGKAFVESLTQPIIFLIITIVLIWIMKNNIIPSLSSTFPVQKWQGMAALMAESTVFINPSFFVPFLLFLALTSGFIYFSLDKWTGKSRLMAEKALPFIYGFYRDYQGTIWMQGFSALLQSGIPDVTALENQITIANPWMAERLKAILMIMKNGHELSDAMTYAGPQRFSTERPLNGIKYDFPSPDMIDELSVYAGFSDFYKKLYTIQKTWMTGLEKKAYIMANIIGVLFRFIMYAYFIVITLGTNALSTQMGSGGS